MREGAMTSPTSNAQVASPTSSAQVAPPTTTTTT